MFARPIPLSVSIMLYHIQFEESSDIRLRTVEFRILASIGS